MVLYQIINRYKCVFFYLQSMKKLKTKLEQLPNVVEERLPKVIRQLREFYFHKIGGKQNEK